MFPFVKSSQCVVGVFVISVVWNVGMFAPRLTPSTAALRDARAAVGHTWKRSASWCGEGQMFIWARAGARAGLVWAWGGLRVPERDWAAHTIRPQGAPCPLYPLPCPPIASTGSSQIDRTLLRSKVNRQSFLCKKQPMSTRQCPRCGGCICG